MMLLEGFPLPVSVLPDEESCVVVHRNIRGATHLDDRHCWCCPRVFTHEEINSLTTAQFNAVIDGGVQ